MKPVFQFLIGKIKTGVDDDSAKIQQAMFQFLIGKIKTFKKGDQVAM